MQSMTIFPLISPSSSNIIYKLQHIWYMLQSSVQTRRSSGAVKTNNFDGVLKCLSNSNITKSTIKKIGTEVVQLLLAYAFQVSKLLSCRVYIRQLICHSQVTFLINYSRLTSAQGSLCLPPLK